MPIDWQAFAAALSKRDAQLSELDTIARASVATLERVEEDLAQIKRHLDNGDGADLAELRQKLNTTTADVTRLAADHTALKAEVGAMADHQGRFDRDLGVLEGTVESFRARIEALEEGKEPPPPPPPPVDPPPTGDLARPPLPQRERTVEVNPGMSATQITAALQTPGALILVKGAQGHRYARFRINPPDGAVIMGHPDHPIPVFDGMGQTDYFIHSGAKDLHLEHLEVTGYNPGVQLDSAGKPTNRGDTGGSQRGAIEAQSVALGGRAERWTLVALNIHHNVGRALTPAYASKHWGCQFNDNVGRTGVGGPGGLLDFILCEFNRNNRGNFYLHHESGGIKLTGGGRDHQIPPYPGAYRDRLLSCTLLDNIGPGAWWDWDCLGMIIEGCLIAGNRSPGVLLEATSRAEVRRNVLIDNARGSHDPNVVTFNASAVGMQNAKDTLIEDNLIYVANPNAWITSVFEQLRGGGILIGWFSATRNTARGNTILLAAAVPETFHEQHVDSRPCTGSTPGCTGMRCISEMRGQWRLEPRGGVWQEHSLCWHERGDDWCFVPGPGQDHLNKVGRAGNLILSGSAAWLPERKLPDWTTPPTRKS